MESPAAALIHNKKHHLSFLIYAFTPLSHSASYEVVHIKYVSSSSSLTASESLYMWITPRGSPESRSVKNVRGGLIHLKDHWKVREKWAYCASRAVLEGECFWDETFLRCVQSTRKIEGSLCLRLSSPASFQPSLRPHGVKIAKSIELNGVFTEAIECPL